MAIQYSIQKMVSDGTLSTIALGIQYLQRNDIYMRIAGEETPQSGAPSGYTWSFINNTTLKILPVVPNGIEVVVYRRTDVDAMYNIYSQNAQFDEATIDENNQQLLYIAQEYLEQGIPGAGVDTIEFLRDDGSSTYYRIKRTDGSYSEEFTVPSVGSITKILAREALRRSYAEAGYNLVAGSFEVGGTLVNANDVLLQERTGKAFSGPAGTVAAGTNPASGGFVDKSGSVQDFINSQTFPNVDAMLAFDGLVVGQKLKTFGYYEAGDGGGAAWDVVLTSSVTINGIDVIQSMSNSLVSLVLDKDQNISIEMLGAQPTTSANSDAATNRRVIQHVWDNYRQSYFSDGIFEFDDTLFYPSGDQDGIGWKFSGKGDLSRLRYIGPASKSAMKTRSASYGITLDNFTLSGPDDTITHDLLDLLDVRYSQFRNIKIYNGRTCCILGQNWVLSFENCTFRPREGGVYLDLDDSFGVRMINRDATVDVVNAASFRHCRFETAKYGVENSSGGRGITFDGQCVFEDNYIHIGFSLGNSINLKKFIIEGCYLEKHHRAPIEIVEASGSYSCEGITFQNNIVQCSNLKALAGLLNLPAPTSGLVGIDIIDNTVELISSSSEISSGYLINTPNGSGSLRINYQTKAPSIIRYTPSIGAGYKPFDPYKINMQKFSSNVWFGLTYANGSDGSPFAPVNTQGLVMRVERGFAYIQGSVINANNTTPGESLVCQIPATANPIGVVAKTYYRRASAAVNLAYIYGNYLRLNQLTNSEGIVDLTYNITPNSTPLEIT